MCRWDWRHVMSLTLKLSELKALDSTPFCPSCAATQGEMSGGTEGIALGAAWRRWRIFKKGSVCRVGSQSGWTSPFVLACSDLP